MKNIKEILENDDCVWFVINENDRKEFLEYAKDNGCKWLDGSEINLSKDKCGFCMGIRKNLTMGVVPMFSWVKKENTKPTIIKFKDILEVSYEENYNK